MQYTARSKFTDAFRGYFRLQQSGRYLLIKRLGAGFWADVDHVIGQFAAAEIMGRTPVVDWGKNGPYADGVNETFGLYFNPVSDRSATELPPEYYPMYWNSENISADLPFEAVAKSHPDYSYPAEMLSGDLISFQKDNVKSRHRKTKYLRWRKDAVVVSMCHERLSSIARIRSSRSSIYDLGETEARQKLVRKYLRLRAPLEKAITVAITDMALTGRYVSLHIRGGDKIFEDPGLHAKNLENIDLAAKWLSSNNDGRVFLLTDSNHYLKICSDRFGPRLATREVSRSDNVELPSFMTKQLSGYQNGLDIIVDTYIAARGEAFFGNEASNVAKFVNALR